MTETVSSPDYSRLIDAETWAFIKRTEQYYPPDTVDLSIERQREIYDGMCREFYRGYPAGVVSEDATIDKDGYTVGLRSYKNTNQLNTSAAIVVYFHGGGFVVGSLESHDDICAEICSATRFRVVAVDYRLSPEHTHPVAFQDALIAVLSIARENPQPLVLCGDSAGGNLAAAVSHAVRGKSINLAGQLLIYPTLGGEITKGSYVEHANAPMLTTLDVKYYLELRRGKMNIESDFNFAPLLDNNFSELPPTVVFSAECDPLCDDSEQYANALVAAGGRACCIKEAGMVHGYLRARSTVTRAHDSFTRILDKLAMLGHQEWSA